MGGFKILAGPGRRHL